MKSRYYIRKTQANCINNCVFRYKTNGGMKMNPNYVVRIVENDHPGLNLSYLVNRLVKYLNRKSEKSSPPTKGEDGTRYILRNGLNVMVRPRTNAGLL